MTVSENETGFFLYVYLHFCILKLGLSTWSGTEAMTYIIQNFILELELSVNEPLVCISSVMIVVCISWTITYANMYNYSISDTEQVLSIIERNC